MSETVEHTLSQHTAKPHSQLDGVGADDHHAQAHSLASHSSEAHSELTGVGADDHHPQSHAHGSHSGIGADDHHTEVLQATQAEAEAESNIDRYVPPDLLHFGPWASKAWCNWHMNGTQAIDASYNITSITDDGLGRTTVTIATDFSSVNYNVGSSANGAARNINHAVVAANAVGSLDVGGFDNANGDFDLEDADITLFGDQ